jgi:hypothetical protein
MIVRLARRVNESAIQLRTCLLEIKRREKASFCEQKEAKKLY